MTAPEPSIEIVGQPEPLTGVTEFHCRCGFVLSTADHKNFAAYEKARKEHRDACPMRFDKPWPFDRLPSLRRTKTPSETGPAMAGNPVSEGTDADPSALRPRTVRPAVGPHPAATQTPGATDAPVAGLEPRDGVSDLFRSPRVWLGALLGPPAWVVRRWEVGL